MAKVFIEETTLTDIADAIREKSGLEDLIATGDMATEIRNIETGGSGDGYYIPEEAFVISGWCNSMFQNGRFKWLIEEHGDKITTKNINDGCNMFAAGGFEDIPFTLNFDKSKHNIDVSRIFQNNHLLQNIGDINDLYFIGCTSMFESCNSLTQIPNFVDCLPMGSDSSISAGNHKSGKIFSGCHSLSEISPEVLSYFNYCGNYAGNAMYNYCFNKCYNLGELIDVPVSTGTFTSNIFQNTFNGCYRLGRFTFETNEDGTPKTANWSKQTIDLASFGWGYKESYFYNSGQDVENAVNDRAAYVALFEDDVINNNYWYSGTKEYSRYNRWSAVETINSLPDTSAAGGGNIIMFYTTSGSDTCHGVDGTKAAGFNDNQGAINQMTEEEIAVATAKGWTVSFTNSRVL